MGIMTIIEPENMPAEPKPAMALPVMKTADVGAAAQITEPISKTTMTAMYVLPVTISTSSQKGANMPARGPGTRTT